MQNREGKKEVRIVAYLLHFLLAVQFVVCSTKRFVFLFLLLIKKMSFDYNYKWYKLTSKYRSTQVQFVFHLPTIYLPLSSRFLSSNNLVFCSSASILALLSSSLALEPVFVVYVRMLILLILLLLL